MKILIKNGRIINPSTGLDDIRDLLIENNKVAKIGRNLTDVAEKIINADNMWVTPGLIDLHVHLREPGYEYKETIYSGTRSAAAGGFTTICCMPNTKPVTDCADVVKFILDKNKEHGIINVLPIGSVTKGQQGLELSSISEMISAGACGISEDGKTVINAALMKEALMIAEKEGVIMFSHCEDIDLVANGHINDGEAAKKFGFKGISNDSEEVIISRDIILAKSTGAKLHICHISTSGGVQLLREAKLRREKVTGEACPHHFILSEEDIKTPDANFKMAPPLRAKNDVDHIIKGLCDDTIDVIATDHAPHHIDEKNCEFEKAANGIVGLETAVSLCITALISSGRLTPSKLIEKMSVNPAKVLGIKKGNIDVGCDADITIIDPNVVYKIDTNNFYSKGVNSPFDNYETKGKVEYTIVNGKVVYEKGEIL